MNTDPALAAQLERIAALRTDEGERALARIMAESKGHDWDGKYKGTEYANHGYWMPIARAVIAHILGER